MFFEDVACSRSFAGRETGNVDLSRYAASLRINGPRRKLNSLKPLTRRPCDQVAERDPRETSS
jgi:hypothetical protein